MANETTNEKKVFLTGATGFVGRSVLRRLLSLGYHPVCLVRDASRAQVRMPGRCTWIEGSLDDREALAECAESADACIHLVGIIMEIHRRGQTFERIHVEGTRNVVQASRSAGVKRFIHMSALGSHSGAESDYHRTKAEAERLVQGSGLDWTIFQPSLIHGPDGEFTLMLRDFACGLAPPFMPYFGSGLNRVQPVYVEDVAECFVKAVSKDQTIGKVFPMGGPDQMTWRELYDTAAMVFRGGTKLKLGIPAWIARTIGGFGDVHDRVLGTRRPLFIFPPIPFNRDQVVMSQSDSICDPAEVQDVFGIEMAPFAETILGYRDLVA
jgi:NADH dehydrogenase